MPGCRSRDDFPGRPFSFIHIPKTAGVSISDLLEPHSEPYWKDYPLLEAITDRSLDGLNRHHGILHWHMLYEDIERYYGIKTMAGLHSFAFIRNPWDWLVSYYNFIRQTKDHYEFMIVGYMDFEQFLRFWKTKKMQQWDWVKAGDKLGVKKLYKIEEIECSIDALSSDIGVPLSQPQRLNVSERKPYQDYYTERTVRYVRDLCPIDIELGGYEF